MEQLFRVIIGIRLFNGLGKGTCAPNNHELYCELSQRETAHVYNVNLPRIWQIVRTSLQQNQQSFYYKWNRYTTSCIISTKKSTLSVILFSLHVLLSTFCHRKAPEDDGTKHNLSYMLGPIYYSAPKSMSKNCCKDSSPYCHQHVGLT